MKATKDNKPKSYTDFFKLPIDHTFEEKMSPLYAGDMPTGYVDENNNHWKLTITDGEFTRQQIS